MTITKINVRFPRAPIVEMIILNNTFIVVHDWANLSTRNYSIPQFVCSNDAGEEWKDNIRMIRWFLVRFFCFWQNSEMETEKYENQTKTQQTLKV